MIDSKRLPVRPLSGIIRSNFRDSPMRLRSSTTMRALMAQYDLSMGAVATDAGCSKGFVSHLLSGRRSSCTPELARRFSDCLHVPVDVLFAETNDDRMTVA